MDDGGFLSFVEAEWDKGVLPTLRDYVAIPNQSPLFDAQWREHGFMDKAVGLVSDWIKRQGVAGAKVEVVRLGDRTPVIFVEVGGRGDDVVLLYGHLDKQPPMEPWSEGLSPWKPVIRDGRLYGRGGADDGYAAFASTTAIRALQAAKTPHARLVMLIECCEESGSFDLPHYIEALAPRIGTPSLVICLDSGCGDYERLWSTTSLRGLVSGDLTVEVLTEGVHSGDGSGVVPSSFRILRRVLSRLENDETGEITPRAFHCEIPEARVRQAKATAGVIGDAIWTKMPAVPGLRPVTSDLTELMLNRTWRPMLSITGQAGLPPLESAGNVLRPRTSVKISLRVPPRCDAETAARELKRLFEQDPPYGAKVSFSGEKASAGWDAPPLEPWLEKSVAAASRATFGKDACYMGEGGSIPFMGMLGKRFPKAQFLITGVLGPHSNAHGPNEFLDLATAKRLTASVAAVIADHFPPLMLGLKSASGDAWLAAALADPVGTLGDHAHCEKKAAASALSLISHHPEDAELVDALLELAREELDHFARVVAALRARGAPLGRDRGDDYVRRLRKRSRGGARGGLLDSLVTAALIEARSCERFALLADGCRDGELRALWRDLGASEARHAAAFMDFARRRFGGEAAERRFDELAAAEAEIVASLPGDAAIHG